MCYFLATLDVSEGTMANLIIVCFLVIRVDFHICDGRADNGNTCSDDCLNCAFPLRLQAQVMKNQLRMALLIRCVVNLCYVA